MKLISLNTAKCVKCYACVKVCPMSVIEITEEGFPEAKRSAYQLCINCGYCVDVCIYDALYHRIRKRSSDSQAALKRFQAMQKDK